MDVDETRELCKDHKQVASFDLYVIIKMKTFKGKYNIFGNCLHLDFFV